MCVCAAYAVSCALAVLQMRIPGTIEAENFDVGKVGDTYNDLTPANTGGNIGYRPDAPAVDIEFGNAVDKVHRCIWHIYEHMRRCHVMSIATTVTHFLTSICRFMLQC